MGFLTALGQDVEIIVRPTRKKEHGRVSVTVTCGLTSACHRSRTSRAEESFQSFS